MTVDEMTIDEMTTDKMMNSEMKNIGILEKNDESYSNLKHQFA